MKKLIALFTVLALAGGLLYSCSKENVTPTSSEKSLKASPALQTYYFTKTTGQNTTTLGKLEYYDPMCVGTPHVLTFSEFTNGTNIKLDQWDPTLNNGVGGWSQVVIGNQNSPYSFSLTAPSIGTFKYRARIGNSGFTEFSVSAIQCCTPGFTYFDNGNGTYTFTLVPAEDIPGAELAFTFAQSAYQSGLPASENWMQAGNNGQVMKTTMDLYECETYTWTVSLAANCSGHSGQSNVWTDFKINGVSQKNNPEDKFVQSCN